jgi:hypothetical protein
MKACQSKYDQVRRNMSHSIMKRNVRIVVLCLLSALSVNAQSVTFEKLQSPASAALLDLVYDGADRLYLLTSDGLFWTTDGGNTWAQPDTVLNHGVVTCVARVSNNIIFAGTVDSGLYQSTDAGLDWRRVPLDSLISNAINAILFTPKAGLFCAVNNGVYSSGDTGRTWINPKPMVVYPSDYGRYPCRINSLSANPVGVLLASGDNNGGRYTYIFSSQDSGKNWTPLSYAGPAQGFYMFILNNAVCDPRNNDSLYILEAFGYSGTWSEALEYTSLFMNFSSTAPKTLFQSRDNLAYSNSLTYALDGAGRVFLAYDGALRLSNDGGTTWTIIGYVAPRKIVIDGRNTVFCLVDSEIVRSVVPVSVAGSTGPMVNDYKLFRNYPNPFNPSTTILFSIAERSRVRVTIFNLLGQQVAELANEEMSAGYFEKTWNANVASGLYFYRLEAVSVSNPGKRFADVKKMILLR